MIKLAVLSLSSLALVTTLNWKDCVKKGNASVIIHDFKAPSHVFFPSQVHFSLNMTFTQRLTQVYVDFEIIKYFLGFPLKLPCKVGTIIGTCSNRDMCYLLNLTLTYTEEHPEYYGYQFQKVMNATLNHTLKCPIEKGNLYIEDAVFELSEISPVLHLLTDGNYTVKITAKDNNTANANIIGCIQVNLAIGGQDLDAGPGYSIIG